MTTPEPVTGATQDPRGAALLAADGMPLNERTVPKLLADIDRADAAAGIRRVRLDEAIERAAKRDFDNARTMRYGHGPTWEAAPEERRQAARNRVREIITAALGDAP